MTAVRIVVGPSVGGNGFWANRFEDAKVIFRYDEDLLEVIRETPGRRWNADSKYWTVPDEEVNDLARRLRDEGAQVTVDRSYRQEEQKPPPREPPPRREPPPNPFVTVLGALPVHLRQPMYRAMSRVLHPDVGGDTVLMQKLNAAWQVYERSAG